MLLSFLDSFIELNLIYKIYSHFYGFYHTLFVGPALTRFSKGSTMINRSSNNRQTNRNIDATHTCPLVGSFVVFKSDNFHRYMSLIMIHNYCNIILTANDFGKNGIRRNRSLNFYPIFFSLNYRGNNFFNFFMAEKSTFPSMRI